MTRSQTENAVLKDPSTDTPTQSYFVESGQARKARSGLDTLGISYTESSWQPGIREFVVDASDPAKLRKVFG